MLLQIPGVLASEQVHELRAALEVAAWVDGKVVDRTITEDLRGMVLKGAESAPRFVSAALPTRVLPPVFYRDQAGEPSQMELSRAIRTTPGGSTRIRTDLTATLYVSDPNEYDGGDLVLRDGHIEQCIKLRAGDLILYPSGSRQEIRAVTRGVCFRCVFWIQSMIRDNGQRKILFDMDTAIQSLSEQMPNDPSIIKLTGVYHNLLRYWAQV